MNKKLICDHCGQLIMAKRIHASRELMYVHEGLQFYCKPENCKPENRLKLVDARTMATFTVATFRGNTLCLERTP